ERPVRQRLRRAAGRRSTGHPVAETHQGRCGRSAVVDPGGGLNQIRAEEGSQTDAALPPVPERSALRPPFGLTLLTFDGCPGRIPDVPGRPKRRRTCPTASLSTTAHV